MKLEIPERAVDAALAENTVGLKSGEAALIRLEAAAPIIVATRLRQIMAALLADRDKEIKVAERWATILDEQKPPADDYRHQILSDLKGRIDGIRLAVHLLTSEINELDPGGGL